MADPQLEKFLKAAATKRAATQAPAAVKPAAAVAAVPPSAPLKVAKEAEKRTAPSAEPVTPSAEDVKKAEKMRADLLEELPLEDFYSEAARLPLTGVAVESYARKSKIPRERFMSLAGVQGIDVEDMAQKAREGVPFAEYRRTREGVVGFKPAAERAAEFDRIANDFQAAERGEAPQRSLGIQQARETTTTLPVLGEGYEVGGTTPDEVIETTKPGEHQYTIASQFIDAFEKANPEVVQLTDMYGQNAGAGNTQKWIEKYVKTQVRNRGLSAASPDIDAQMGKLRRDALYYILSKKTVGQWTPGIFVKDVQITDAERAAPLGTAEGIGAGVRDVFASMSPNVEIIGFNNKGQAVVRQESPAGTALRLLDVLGVSPIGKVKGVPVVIPGQSAITGLLTKDEDEGYLQAALRGVQTGASFVDATLDATKGQSTPVRAIAGLASLVPTVLYPDVTGAAGGAYKAAKAYRQVLQDRKIAKAGIPLLDDQVKALQTGDYEKATKIETAIRSHPELSAGNHGIMQAQMSMDAQVAEKLKAMNPELASLTPTLGDELITVGVNQSPELAEAIYGEAVKGYPFLHFSKKAPELAARSEKEGIGPTLEAYVNSGDFGRHFQRIERAKAAFLKAAPKNSAEAIDQAVSGLAANLRAKGLEAFRAGGNAAADAPLYERLAKLLEDNKAAIVADPKIFGKGGTFRTAMKADPILGADSASEFRKSFYPQAANLAGRVESLKTIDFDTLYQNDLKVFDRAREAVEANIKSRMMAAELLKRELGAQAKINVVPTEILDDLMEPGTERLSAFATAKFIRTMQQLPKAADRKAWLAAFQTMDKMLRGAAELRGVPVDTYWRSIDIRVVDGKPVFVKGEDVVSAPKGPGPLDGFVDVVDVQTAVARLRGALAGTDPSYRLKSLLRADGSQAGGEVAVGDVVVRAIRNPQPGAPYRVEVFVGAQQKAAFTSTGKLEDAINEGIDEAQNAMTGRVAAGEPAMREVVVPKPPKTAAQAAAQTSPADAAEEAAAVDSVAATPPAAPLHPKTETVVGGLDPALKADPDVVSRILAAVDKLKAGSKLPPPPKGANKVLMGAVREELLKSGVLVKLDDGSVVKAGTLPEDVKVAPTAAPTAPPVAPAPVATAAEAEAPVFQRVAEEVAPPPEETLEELTARLSRDAEDLRAAEIRAEEEFAAAQAERERAFAERMRAREAAPPAGEEHPLTLRAYDYARRLAADPTGPNAPRTLIGRGGNADVFEIPGEPDLVARVVRRRDPATAVEGLVPSITPNPMGAANVGQPLAQVGDTTILVRQRGFPAGMSNTDPAFKQANRDEIYADRIRAAAALPQEAYDQAARDLLLANERGLNWDPSKSNNVLIDPESGRFGLVDLSARSPGSSYRNTAGELVVALSGNTHAYSARELIPALEAPRRQIIEKAQAAAERTGLPLTRGGEVDSSFEYSKQLAGITETEAPVARVTEEVVAEPVIQRAPAAEEPLPVARKAKGFSDKNSLDAGVYEVEVGGQTRRFFRDTKEGPFGAAWVEDVRGDAGMPITFLGNTKDDAIKALQRKYVAEAAPVARAAEEAAAVPEAVKAEEVAAPAQPTGITPAAEAPVVREEIVQPPAAPPAKAEPTVDELQATVDRLAPLRDAPIKRTNVSKTGFTIEIDGQQIRVQKSDDNWVNAATGRKLGETASDVVEKLRLELIQKPYTAAKDALERLGKAQAQAATLSSLADALAGVKKIRTFDDAEKFFGVVEQLPLDGAERLDVLAKFKDKLSDLMAKSAGKTVVSKDGKVLGAVSDKFDTLIARVDDAATELRPAAAEAPSAAAAAQDALTAQQRHAQAVARMRTLTHRAEVTDPKGIDYVLYGTVENDRFVPVTFVSAREAATPSAARAALYDQLTVSDAAFAATRREAEALLEGQTPVTRAFPANKYANDADIEFGQGLRQVRPTAAGGPQVVTGAFKPGGGVGLAGTQSIIELAAKTADPTTLLHEGAHYIRKSILDAEDMDNVTAWLNSMGVKVKHEFGEFVGSAYDVELAEEMFATAFEKYVVTGKAPTPPLERVFELVKNAFAGAYRWMKSDAAKELYGEDTLSPQVTAVFDKYFTAVPTKPIESTFDIIVRETRGAKAADAEGALDVLAREAGRKGMPKTTRDDLVNKIAALKLSDDVPSDTVLLDFPAPVLGRTQWTKGDIIALQAEVVSRRNQLAVIPMRQALFGQPEETKVTENIYAALTEREEGQLAAGARGIARGLTKLVLGGDIVTERGVRALPPGLRRDLDTSAGIIETTIGDSITVLTQATRDDDPSFMFRYLAGENLRYKSGRRVLSSGHEHITGFFDLYRNQYASMTREEQALLQEWAQLLNTVPNPENLRDPKTISEALAGAAFPRTLEGVKNFEDLERQRQVKTNAMIDAITKFIDLGGSGEGNIGGQLRKAIKDAAGEGAQIAFNEYRFAEVLLFLSGSTSRRGVRFIPVDATFSKDQLVEQAKILLTDAQRIYGGEDDPLFSRRLSILVAAYGSSRRAKAELAALGAVLTAEEAHAFKNWTLGYDTSPEMSAQLELVKSKFGLNTKFVNETILGDNVYVPAQARARMADALAKAQFNNAKLTPTGDLYQKVWTYMKKRMTRGAFVLRQRYFFVNTIDHFNQMYLLVGFAPAAASSARLLLQGAPVNIIGQGWEMLIRLGDRAGLLKDRAGMERFRDLLSRGGSDLAARIGSALSVSKYRIEVNDILEGRDKLLMVGGNVYTARQLRDMFVAERIFSSFDTRRLAESVRMEGDIFSSELAKISGSSKSSGTFADAASRLMDGVQDVTVDVVDDLSDAWAERERIGAVITLIETGMDARAACRITVDALYDYSQSMTKGDRSFLVGTILPFWAFQKNANQQFINVMFTPYGAYRMMALQRLREGVSALASELYYGYIGGELGLDVDNMPQDMQDLYYAIMLRAHEVYGDELPDKVRIGLRIAMTGRVNEVVEGKYYELDASLIEKMRSGGLVPGGKFGGAGMADYMLAAPNKSGLPSYVRDRFGMVAPQRRNALVRHYGALMGGANEDYFYFMLPESSVESAYKHTATFLGGAFLTAGALTPEWAGIPGVEIMAGGADSVSLGDIGRALQPVVDLERSPVLGLALGMYSERGYPQRLHPTVASALQRMAGAPVLRVPAKMDPFMGGTLMDTDEAFRARLEAANAVKDGVVGGTDAAGNPTDLVQILGEDYVRMVQELNSKDLPADVMAIAKDERFYLPPGFMSLSFENSPLGEFNRELLRREMTPQEGADPAGTAAYYTRILLGTDVVQVSPSRTAQQEEPVRYTKTREPI